MKFYRFPFISKVDKTECFIIGMSMNLISGDYQNRPFFPYINERKSLEYPHQTLEEMFGGKQMKIQAKIFRRKGCANFDFLSLYKWGVSQVLFSTAKQARRKFE